MKGQPWNKGQGERFGGRRVVSNVTGRTREGSDGVRCWRLGHGCCPLLVSGRRSPTETGKVAARALERHLGRTDLSDFSDLLWAVPGI